MSWTPGIDFFKGFLKAAEGGQVSVYSRLLVDHITLTESETGEERDGLAFWIVAHFSGPELPVSKTALIYWYLDTPEFDQDEPGVILEAKCLFGHGPRIGETRIDHFDYLDMFATVATIGDLKASTVSALKPGKHNSASVLSMFGSVTYGRALAYSLTSSEVIPC